MQIIGKDGKTYNTVDECMKADEAFDKAIVEKEKQETEAKNALSLRKKEKANAIQAADEELNLAQVEYDKVRAEAKKVIEEAQVKAKNMIKVAADKYREASDNKYKAIREFNKEFGTYTTTYTGQKALEEYNRITSQFNDFFDNFFKGWF